MLRKTLFSVLLISLVLASSSICAQNPVNVLIIDSGSDFTHDILRPLARANEAELNGKKGKDSDGNGYIDDVYGWNFVENSSQLVNLADTPPQYDRVLRTMELLGKLQAVGREGMSTDEFDTLVKNYNDKNFWPWVDFVGGWAHGTHCAGIVAIDNKGVRLNAIKHIQTGSSPAREADAAISYVNHKIAHGRSTVRETDPQPAARQKVTLRQLEAHFKSMGKDYAKDIMPRAKYIASLKPRLINCSFGTDNATLFESFKRAMILQWGFKDPTDAEVQKVVNLFVKNALLVRDKAMFEGVPDALIFIAAGNSASNLDGFLSSPNNVPLPNTIVVAATDNDQKIAPFSCFGRKTVDIAVPGVGIYATYPNNRMGHMTGTSMACPLALNYASRVLQVNDKLTPRQLKRILMGTVDKKEWLKDKVRSGGVVNENRAVYAAKLMLEGRSLRAAVAAARRKVADKAHRAMQKTRPDLNDPLVRQLYFSVIR